MENHTQKKANNKYNKEATILGKMSFFIALIILLVAIGLFAGISSLTYEDTATKYFVLTFFLFGNITFNVSTKCFHLGILSLAFNTKNKILSIIGIILSTLLILFAILVYILEIMYIIWLLVWLMLSFILFVMYPLYTLLFLIVIVVIILNITEPIQKLILIMILIKKYK